MRKRRVNLNRFKRFFAAFFLGLCVHGSDIVKPVRKFYQNNANIFCHGKQHFSDIFYLLLFAGIERKFVQFGNAVDKLHDVFAELFFYLIYGYGSVFYRIVQKCGDNGVRITFVRRKNLCDMNGVRDIRLSALSELPLMGGGREIERFPYPLHIVVSVFFKQVYKTYSEITSDGSPCSAVGKIFLVLCIFERNVYVAVICVLYYPEFGKNI